MSSIPASFQPYLWSVDIHKLDLQKDKDYIVHQLLSHGSLDCYKWLFKTYNRDEIVRIFKSQPFKNYRAARFNLVKNHLLELKNVNLDERYYVENTPRVIR